MEIKIDWKSALILLLAIGIIMAGLYFWRDGRIHQVEQMKAQVVPLRLQVQAMSVQIQQTQGIFDQLRFPREVAQALQSANWQVKEQALPTSTTPG